MQSFFFSLLYINILYVIQGESSQVEKLEGGDRGGQDEQKIIWEGAKYFFFYGRVVGNEISFLMVCLTCRFKVVFVEF